MPHNKTIQAIRIYLDSVVAENTELGIYTSGTSEIRISEEPLSGVALTWTYGLIAKNGIGAISEGGDTRRGGCPVNYDGLSVALVDTNQWLLKLKKMNVNLPDLTIEVWEFVGSETDNDSVSASVVFTGVIEDMSWDEAVLEIPAKNARYKRNANIATANDLGGIIPATFGNLYPIDSDVKINNLAKFVRGVDSYDDTTYSNAYFDSDGTSYPLITLFPIKEIDPDHLHYTCRMPGTSGNVSLPTPTDIYVIVKCGDGNKQIRLVTEWECVNYTGFYGLRFGIKDVFSAELAKTGDTISWVQFVKIGREYSADKWKCKDFLSNKTGNSVTTPELFTYNEKAFDRIADFGFSIKDSNKNTLDIDGSQYSNDIDTVDSFLIFPVTSLALEDASSLTKWNHGVIDFSSAIFNGPYSKLSDGVYKGDITITPPNSVSIDTNTLSNPSYAYNKNSTDYALRTLTISYSLNIQFAFLSVLKFGLPVLPKDLSVEGIYLGIKGYQKNDFSLWQFPSFNSPFFIAFRRFSNTLTGDRILSNNNITDQDLIGINLDDLPDQYFTDLPSTNNINFYRDSVEIGGKFNSLYGYNLYKLACSQNEYETYLEGGIFEYCGINTTSGTKTLITRINELAIIAKLSSSDIKKDVYSPASGRIFNSTWGSRKTSTDLITNPKDILEHCKRLQNWSETGETGIEWGKEYATTAKIKTSGDGSYDSPNLTYLTDQTPAFQVEDESEAYTDELTKKLCNTYGLCTYIDSDGTECIETLEKTYPSELIYFTDILGEIGQVREPQIQDIYVEPVVNYCYNAGSGDYDEQIRIYNIQGYTKGDGSWEDCSSGFASQSDAEAILDIYADLWAKYRSVESCPSDFSDQRFIVTYADAKSYLTRKGNWMGKPRISLTVSYDKGKSYHFAKHVQLNLPHQTGGEDVECLIEKVEKSKNDNAVKLNLVLLEDIPVL